MVCRRNRNRGLNAIVRSRTKKTRERVNIPATGIVAATIARSGQRSLRMKTEDGRKKRESFWLPPSVFRLSLLYCIGVPPDGAEGSLPPAPMELAACQMVPVVLMKK